MKKDFLMVLSMTSQNFESLLNCLLFLEVVKELCEDEEEEPSSHSRIEGFDKLNELEEKMNKSLNSQSKDFNYSTLSNYKGVLHTILEVIFSFKLGNE